jgi:GntR family transcriptional regulator/MocR family aminotransferase
MRRWELSVGLDASRDQPLFLQLASAVADEIRSGRLKPGDPLPGSRELAGHLGVNRNTVVAGYGELAAEGLVSTRVGGGTFVSAPLARHDGSSGPIAPSADLPTYPLTRPLQAPTAHAAVAPGALTLAISMPDVRCFPRPRSRARSDARSVRAAALHWVTQSQVATFGCAANLR